MYRVQKIILVILFITILNPVFGYALDEYQGVRVKKIEILPIARVSEAVYFTFDPSHHSKFPLYAYSLSDTLMKGACRAFSGRLIKTEFALVSSTLIDQPDDQIIEYAGLKTPQDLTSDQVCGWAMQNLLNHVVGQSSHSKHRIVQSSYEDDHQCLIPIMNGRLTREGYNLRDTVDKFPVTWKSKSTENDFDLRMVWTPVNWETDARYSDRLTAETSFKEQTFWQFKLVETDSFKGKFFISFDKSSQALMKRTEWEQNIDWLETPVFDDRKSMNLTGFTMWYEPFQCDGELDRWYLVSVKPFRLVKSRFRITRFFR